MRQPTILALLAPSRWARLQVVRDTGFVLEAETSWVRAFARVRSGGVDLVIVDPLREGAPGTGEIERLRALYPSLPLLVYTALTPDVATSLLVLGRLQVRRVLFERYDDAPALLRAAIQSELLHLALEPVVQSLRDFTRRLPVSLRQALETTLRTPSADGSVRGLAARAGVSPRTCERWFARAWLPPPRTVVALMRVLSAHRMLQDPECTVEDAARRLGFGGTRPLQTWSREVFGRSAGVARADLSWEDALALVLKRYFGHVERVAS